MSKRSLHLKKFSWLSSRILSDNAHGRFHRPSTPPAICLAPSLDRDLNIGSKTLVEQCLSRGFASVRRVSRASSSSPSSPYVDLLSYIRASLDKLEGPSHHWLNRDIENKQLFKDKGTYVVLAGNLLNGRTDPTEFFEKLKLLQQRSPGVCFMGIHFSDQARVTDDRTALAELIVNEYLTFPVLLSEKEFSKTSGEVRYIVFKDFKNPLIYEEKDLDIASVAKALDSLAQDIEKSKSVRIFTNTWSKQAEAIKESHFSSFFQDLLLYYPGCISADEVGDRLFLSDTNHHRIIMFENNGKISDSIGCFPGFEDGEFESAKMLRPTGTLYDEEEDCLYIVDSENHAIRRANITSRVLETVYPKVVKKSGGMWSWIMEKLGLGKDDDTTVDADAKLEEFDARSLLFPWHILKKRDDESLLVSNKSFSKLWMINLASGEIEEVVEGFSKIMEICGQSITEKLSVLKHIPSNWVQQQTETITSCKEQPSASVFSSFTNLGDNIFMTDIACQRVLKVNRESGSCSSIQFSNIGILGLPYWLFIPLERVFNLANGVQEAHLSHTQELRLLPGNISIRLNIEIPPCTEIVEPIQESCIWRQTRGAISEVSATGSAVEPPEKIGVSQQWYDELDSLAKEIANPEADEEEEEVDVNPSEIEREEDGRIHINCTVKTSPGTSELIVYAALYLRLARNEETESASQEELARRIAENLKPVRNITTMKEEIFVKLLAKSKRELRDIVFLKPMHVRIRLDSMDHPKAENSRDVILTDSSVEVDVSL
ncbi:hypothetical protein CARUB_v10016474mg [Capsella rubella]|uniref:Uncharacterized protein n=1 Tax=Capsella rubella TaxID=81985 RepID=R0G2N6_9BRAS|nr:uncharacterized protein LOC17891070 [Capsella rubella]EOA29702.1 hypothetical protein CARUB_v10016474mg [Capsella rubella]